MATKFCCRLCVNDVPQHEPPEQQEAPIFSNYYSLEAHIYQTHYNNCFPFACDICDSHFHSHYNFLRHRQRSHRRNLASEPTPEACFVVRNCPVKCCEFEKEAFVSYEDLKHHLLSTHSSMFRLEKKSTKRSSSTTMIYSETKKSKHDIDSEKSESNKFICFHKHCGASYSTRKKFNLHLRDHEIAKAEKCARCQKRVPELNSATNFFITDVDVSTTKSSCDCLKTHPFQCLEEKCLKVFTTGYNLKMHKQLCHAIELTKYFCRFCEDLFNSERSLFEHIQVHINPRSFPCNLCGELFNQQTALTRHIATIHNGRRAHICCVCGKSFSQSGNLDAHLRNIHKMKCDTCFGEFQAQDKNELEDHIRNCNGHVIYLMENDNCDLQQEIVIAG